MDELYQIRLVEINSRLWAEIVSDVLLIQCLDDALDIIANGSYQGAEGIILREHQVIPSFFDLKTKLAGDILQKFSNYRMKLLLVGDFSKYTSKSLKDFMGESNRGSLVHFSDSCKDVF